MAKFCNRCGKQYDDYNTSCPYCIQQKKTEYIGEHPSQHSYQATTKMGSYNATYNQQGQKMAKEGHSLKAGLLIFCVIIVFLGFGISYASRMADISTGDNLELIEKEIKQYDSWLLQDNISIVETKMLSEEKMDHDNDLRKAKIQIQADGRVLHYDAEYEVICVKTQSGWSVQNCDITRQMFTAKETLTEEQIQEDFSDEETLEKNDLPFFSKIKCNEINILGTQMDYLLEQKVNADEIDSEETPDEEQNHIIAECSIDGTEIAGCETNTYNVLAYYQLDVKQDAWILSGAPLEDVKSSWDLKGTWKCKTSDIFDDYDCVVKIYSMTSDYIEMEYVLKHDGGTETTIEQSEGREKVSYKQESRYCLRLFPQNCRVGLAVHASTDDYPDGAIAYDKARLTRNNK